MCVAVPGRVEWIGSTSDASIPGRVNTGDASHEVNLVMVPQAGVGDYVIAHSGYAIRVVPAAEAEETRRQLGLTN